VRDFTPLTKSRTLSFQWVVARHFSTQRAAGKAMRRTTRPPKWFGFARASARVAGSWVAPPHCSTQPAAGKDAVRHGSPTHCFASSPASARRPGGGSLPLVSHTTRGDHVVSSRQAAGNAVFWDREAGRLCQGFGAERHPNGLARGDNAACPAPPGA